MRKYWIEEVSYDCAHGNRWFVYTTLYPGDPDRELVISIPYHARAIAYANDDEWEDFTDYPEAWDEWLSYTVEQRREYIREFRRNKIINNTPTFQNEILNKYNAWVQATRGTFVTFTPGTAPGCGTFETTKDENMHVNTSDASYAIKNDMATSYRDREQALRKQFYMDPIEPESMAHLAELFEKKHYVKPDDKVWTRKDKWDSPFHMFEFREHPADVEGFDKAFKALQDEYRDLKLKADVLDAKDVLKHVEKFRPTLH